MYVHRNGEPQIFDPKFPISIMYPTGGNEGERVLAARTHVHKEIELVYVLKGAMSFIVQEKQVEITPNQFLFINSSIVHSSKVISDEDATILLLQFDPDVIYNTRSQFEYQYLIPFINHEQIPFRLFKETQSNVYRELEQLLHKTFQEFEQKDMAYEIYIKSALYQILGILYRNHILQSGSSDNSDEAQVAFDKLEKVLQYVEEHYIEDIDLKEVCELVNYNYYYVCRLFKAATGKSFVQYLNFIRVSEAEKLLLSTNTPITDIVTRTGFKSASYFNRIFKKFKGCSPSTYRENL